LQPRYSDLFTRKPETTHKITGSKQANMSGRILFGKGAIGESIKHLQETLTIVGSDESDACLPSFKSYGPMSIRC
jgi:hypothetical protein